jgi:hypothetical protein
MKKLSKTMKEAHQKLREHGKLIRLCGGFWTYPACVPSEYERSPSSYRVSKEGYPSWSTGTQTVRALVERGLAKRVYDERGPHPKYPNAYSTEVRPDCPECGTSGWIPGIPDDEPCPVCTIEEE